MTAYVLEDLSEYKSWSELSDKQQDKLLNFMSIVRNSGVTNMLGSHYLLEDHFKAKKKLASEIIWTWIRFEEKKIDIKKMLTED